METRSQVLRARAHSDLCQSSVTWLVPNQSRFGVHQTTRGIVPAQRLVYMERALEDTPISWRLPGGQSRHPSPFLRPSYPPLVNLHEIVSNPRFQRAGTALVVLLLFALLVTRGLSTRIQPYGNNGGAWIEHLQVAQVTWEISQALADNGGSVTNWIRGLDGGFPPGLKLIAIPGAWVTSGSLTAALAPILVLFLLLGVAVGRMAWAITGQRHVGVAACVGTLLVPGLHGSAIRFYYDLPMTALVWSAAAALFLSWDRRPIQGAAIAMSLAVAASFTKWTTVPFLLCIIAGATLTRTRRAGETIGLWRPRQRVKALVLMLAGWGLVVVAYLTTQGENNSLGFSARESGVVTQGHGETGTFVGGLIHGIAQRMGDYPTLLDKAEDYGLGLLFTVFSPLLLAPVLGLVLFGWVRGAPGASVVLATAVGHVGFLLLMVDPVDERFLITLAPALVLGAAIGWGSLSPLARQLSGVALGVLGLTVAADFHHGAPSGPNTWWREMPVWGTPTDPLPPPIRPRGIFAASSTAHRGWARADAAADPRWPMRDSLDEWMRGCAPTNVAALDSVDLIAAYGDHDWVTWANRVWCLESPRKCEPLQVFPLNWTVDVPIDQAEQAGTRLNRHPSFACSENSLPRDTLVLQLAQGDGAPPPCPPHVTWTRIGIIPDPEGGLGVEAWAAENASPCSRQLATQ